MYIDHLIKNPGNMVTQGILLRNYPVVTDLIIG